MISALSERRDDVAPTAYLVGSPFSATNELLRAAIEATGTPAFVCTPDLAGQHARPGDVVVGRLDVRPTFDGVQPGLGRLVQIRERGVRVVNGADVLVATHDKLATALLLSAASIPQPRAVHVADVQDSPRFEPPYVIKPRFGSWGRDVYLCESRAELHACLLQLRNRRWFARHGALVQELIPPCGFDLRLIVSAGTIVGAIERVAAPGEWRTNIALGGSRRRTIPPPEVCDLAIEAATAVGGDLVGVDLLPGEHGWQVIEVNGAVDFTDEYTLNGDDVFARAVEPIVPIGVSEIADRPADVTPVPVATASPALAAG